MAEFAKYRLLVKVVVKHDALGEIKWEQRVFLGNLEYGCELHLIDFAAFVRAGGGTGLTIPRPRECSPVLDQAFSTPGRVWRKP